MPSHEELEKKYPPGELDDHRRGYAQAGLEGDVVELFYRIRLQSGLSCTELAERLGRTAAETKSLEDFDNIPTLEDFAALSVATGISVRTVVAGVADLDLGADRMPNSGEQ